MTWSGRLAAVVCLAIILPGCGWLADGFGFGDPSADVSCSDLYVTVTQIPGSDATYQIGVEDRQGSARQRWDLRVCRLADGGLTECEGLGSAAVFSLEGHKPGSYQWTVDYLGCQRSGTVVVR